MPKSLTNPHTYASMRAFMLLSVLILLATVAYSPALAHDHNKRQGTLILHGDSFISQEASPSNKPSASNNKKEVPNSDSVRKMASSPSPATGGATSPSTGTASSPSPATGGATSPSTENTSTAEGISSKGETDQKNSTKEQMNQSEAPKNNNTNNNGTAVPSSPSPNSNGCVPPLGAAGAVSRRLLVVSATLAGVIMFC